MVLKILISNDDGIDAIGVLTLVEELHRVKKFDIRVACPAVQNSAMSHAISLHHPLWAEPYTLARPELADITAVRVEGTPADCVKVATQSPLWADWKPDLILSGINAGSNSGLNLIYSGTYAAAVEGTVYGIPAIALSLDYSKEMPRYVEAARYTVGLVSELTPEMLQLLTQGVTLNVNFPSLPENEVKGFLATRQGNDRFKDWYVEQKAPADAPPARRVFRLDGKLEIRDESLEYDTYALQQGYITLSLLPLRFGVHLFEETQKWQSVFSSVKI